MSGQYVGTPNKNDKIAMRDYLKCLCEHPISEFSMLEKDRIHCLAQGYPPFAEAVAEAQKIFGLYAQLDNIIARDEALSARPMPPSYAGDLVRKFVAFEMSLLSNFLPPQQKILARLYKKCGILENTL